MEPTRCIFPGAVLSHANSMFVTSQYIKGDLDLCLALALKAAPSLVKFDTRRELSTSRGDGLATKTGIGRDRDIITRLPTGSGGQLVACSSKEAREL